LAASLNDRGGGGGGGGGGPAPHAGGGGFADGTMASTSGPGVAASEFPPLGGQPEAGSGLMNRAGEYNCFLNVIVQSLWHLRSFQIAFKEEAFAKEQQLRERGASGDTDAGLLAELVALFRQMEAAERARHDGADRVVKAINPGALRKALAKSAAGAAGMSAIAEAQEHEMADAGEVLGVVFSATHAALGRGAPQTQQSLEGCWLREISGHDSCVSRCFGQDITDSVLCRACGLNSYTLKYTSFSHTVTASSLREAQNEARCMEERGLASLLKRSSDESRSCDKDQNGCGRMLPLKRSLDRAPEVFTLSLIWERENEDMEVISATMCAIQQELNLAAVYPGISDHTYRLNSIVCYYGKHYFCFVLVAPDKWLLCDDTKVSEVGSWENVSVRCWKGHLQPSVLFFQRL